MANDSINATTNQSVEYETNNIRQGLDVIQSMIDISADRLEGLRTQCATSAELTQQEIRTLEAKLVKMFSELLITRAKLTQRIPKALTNSTVTVAGSELKQWLRVVGLSPESLNVVLQRVNTLELLLDKNDVELRGILNQNVNIREEEVRRLLRAMFNLKRCREAITGGSMEPNELFWDSWDRHHHTHHTAGASPRAHRSMARFQQHNRINSEIINPSPGNLLVDISIKDATDSSTIDRQTHLISPEDTSVGTLTPSPSPPNSPSVSLSSRSSKKLSIGTPYSHPTQSEAEPINSSTAVPATRAWEPPRLSVGTVERTAGDELKMRALNHPRKFPQSLLNRPSHQHNQIQHHHHHHHQQQQQYQQQFSPPILTPTTTTFTSHFNSCAIGSGNVATVVASGRITQRGIQENGIIRGLPRPASIDHNPTTTEIDQNEHNASTTVNQMNGNLSMIESMSSMSNVPTPRSRLHTEPSPESHNDIVENSSNLAVPRSPCTPIVTRGMGHMIAHRFTKKFKVMSTCDLCNKQMFFGLKCKECKYRCHKDCESNVPPSCGLPPEFIDEFKKSLPSDVFISNTSPNMSSGGSGKVAGGYFSGRRERHRSQAYATQYATGPDSSSAGSSCNSSSPSSPALLTIPLQTPAASKQTQFHFPDTNVVTHDQKQSTATTATATTTTTAAASNLPVAVRNELIPQIYSQDDAENAAKPQSTTPSAAAAAAATTATTNTSSSSSGVAAAAAALSIVVKSTSAEKANVCRPTGPARTSVIDLADTTRSNESGSISASTDSVRSDSTEERESTNWPRQNSLSLKEWDIPFGDLNLLEKIGRGRFGTVHRGLWHGDVAVKLLNEDYLDDERTLEAFKLEVATFKKTRHENLVLFMGFCMQPQAIVTSLCKGNTLYTHIHLRKDKFNLYRATLVAQQISQGMGYLHAKDIIHKDLKTKNIFLENGKVIITDFGVFSAIKLQYSKDGLCISNNWLCYLAPELIRGLRPIPPARDELQFSKASDVYAFGTVWYELLCGEFPFKRQPPEAVIFQVGRGMKQTLANIQASRDVKDILMFCWAYQPDDRPDFPKLLTLLERLPKKRLARSPSHPVQLSRSAESVF